MKQHITLEQLNELNEADKDQLSHWVNSHPNGCSKLHMQEYEDNDLLLTIGQMIEFLNENDPLFQYNYIDNIFLESDYGDDGKSWLTPEKWCDALWQAVKEVLER